LDTVKENSDWNTLSDIFSDTIREITKQLALVTELREKAGDKVTDELAECFTGLELSFKDLIKDAVALAIKHSSKTAKKTLDNDKELEYPVDLYSGKVKDEEEAMDYLNIASAYMNIQDKTVSLISLGWVDLFVKLKYPVSEISDTIKNGLEEIKEAGDAAE